MGWGGAGIHIGYDESNKPVAVKGIVRINVAATGGTLHLGGFYSNKIANSYGLPVDGFTTEVTNWSGPIGYNQYITETLGMEIGYQYFDGFSAAKGGTVRNGHLVQGALSWTPVTNFNVRLEGSYGQMKKYSGVVDKETSGFMWVRRSF